MNIYPDEPFCNSADTLFDMNETYQPPHTMYPPAHGPVEATSPLVDPINPLAAFDGGAVEPLRTVGPLDPLNNYILFDHFLRTDLYVLAQGGFYTPVTRGWGRGGY